MAVGNQEGGHLFLCLNGRMLPRWSEAFESAKARSIHSAADKSEKFSKTGLIWLRLENDVPVTAQMESLAALLRAIPCVVLSDRPTDEEALAAFASGARGYCNTHAAASLLIQVSTVVLEGGLWIGESLMQRLVSATSRLQTGSRSAPLPVDESWAKDLTLREKEVAATLASGASNKEIARTLGITERTVKAHVGAVLEKLHVRDRLQLSLIVNGRATAQG